MRIVLYIIFLLLLSSSCDNSGDTSEKDTGISGRSKSSTADAGTEATIPKAVLATMGKEGGEIELENAKLRVPKDSLYKKVEIGINIVESPIPIPNNYIKASDVYECIPHGLKFAKAVRLEINYEYESNKRYYVLYLENESDYSWSAVDTVNFENGVAGLEIQRFSYFVVVYSREEKLLDSGIVEETDIDSSLDVKNEDSGAINVSICPDGFAPSDNEQNEHECLPVLLDLEISNGRLDPDFSPTTSTYTVKLSLSDESITVTPLAQSEITIEVDGIELSSSNSTSLTLINIGANQFEICVSSGEDMRTYVLTVYRGEPIHHYIKPSNSSVDDWFGSSVSLYGDTLVVGSIRESSGAIGVNGRINAGSVNNSGAVYVFTKDGTTWKQQAHIKASNPDVFDYFGQSVSIYEDTLAIGAIQEDSNATGIDEDQDSNDAENSGAVYIFVREESTWSQQAYIKASNTDSTDGFGISVSLFGDTLAVGSYQESSTARGIDGDQNNNDRHSSGAVYVFSRDGTEWSQEAFIKSSNADAFDKFGNSISLYENTLAVGASWEASNTSGIDGDQNNNDAERSGAVYIFIRNNSTWEQQAYIKASNTDEWDYFGSDVSLFGDTLAVAAIEETSNATGVNGDQSNNDASESGAVYVFTRNDTTWRQQAYLKASNAESNDSFGSSISLYDETLAIGASRESSNTVGINGDQDNNEAGGSGAVYVFTRDETTWTQRTYIKASNTDSGDKFGSCVSLYGHLLVAGSPREDSKAKNINGDQGNTNPGDQGAVYIINALGEPLY